MLQDVTTIIAKQLASENKVISIKDNSILEELELNNSDEHISNISTRIAEKINNELILVKNKLKPMMDEFIKEVKDNIDKIALDSELSKYNIVVFDYPKVIEELSSSGEISSPRTVGTLPDGSASLPTPPVESIREIFLHTSASVNTYAKPILDKKSNEELVNLFNKYFNLISETNPAIQQLGVDSMFNYDELILVYMACNRIMDAGGLNDQQLKMVSALHSELSNHLSIVKQLFENSRAMHKIVLSIKEGTVNVDNDTYKRYLDEGGIQEPLLGMGVLNIQDSSLYTYESIISKKPEYIEAWYNKVKLSQYAQEESNIRRHRVAYDIVLIKFFEDGWLPNDLKDFVTIDYQTANKMFKDVLQEISRADELDVGYVVRELFGRVLFKDTNFKRFADGITEHVRINPDSTPADAATFASLEFILGYLLDQVKVDNVNGNA